MSKSCVWKGHIYVTKLCVKRPCGRGVRVCDTVACERVLRDKVVSAIVRRTRGGGGQKGRRAGADGCRGKTKNHTK